MRYSNVGKEKENGVIYTPATMAKYVAEEMIRFKPQNKGKGIVRILDPAVGKGELLVALINAIKTSSPAQIEIEVVGYETDTDICENTRNELLRLFPDIVFKVKNEDFLEAVEKNTTGKFDYIIANPPYVRTQIMGSNKAQEISNKLKLSGRVDMYYAFLLYTNSVLKNDGIAGYITSNKFLTIKSGSLIRDYILNNYRIHQITDLGDTKLFSASVLPCVIIFSKGTTTSPELVSYTSIYQTSNEVIDGKIDNIFDAIHRSGCFELPDGKRYIYKQGMMQSVDKGALWNICSNGTQKWLSNVDKKTWLRFCDIGKVRVGIKTTADNVFIGDDWSGDRAEIELLFPLITHRNAGQIIAADSELWKVLYTHTIVNGRKAAYDINKYPNSKKYLMQHFEQLSSRKYITAAKRNWYEIWVPQNPEAWRHRKIVFRDISEQPQFWLDISGAIVNGDCYWIDINGDVVDDIVYLVLAVSNSRFIEKYYDMKFNTKLYSGKRRYMSQYVEQFPIPLYTTELAQEAISIVKKIIAEGNKCVAPSYKEKLDDIVDEMFS